jgi:hypothetical protein
MPHTSIRYRLIRSTSRPARLMSESESWYLSGLDTDGSYNADPTGSGVTSFRVKQPGAYTNCVSEPD